MIAGRCSESPGGYIVGLRYPGRRSHGGHQHHLRAYPGEQWEPGKKRRNWWIKKLWRVGGNLMILRKFILAVKVSLLHFELLNQAKTNPVILIVISDQWSVISDQWPVTLFKFLSNFNQNICGLQTISKVKSINSIAVYLAL